MKLLITGVPGTGKTSLGNYLTEHHGFVHKDMEQHEFAPVREFKKDEQAFVDALNTPTDLVVTWGFGSFIQRHLVERLKAEGFTLFWLDGDRVASFRSYMHREKHNDRAEYAYYQQLTEIITTGIVEKLAPIQVNPFTETGAFRPAKDIAEELLGKAAS